MDFFGSDIGVAIAWLCGVASFIYGFMQAKENKKLKISLLQIQNKNQSLQNNIDTLNAKFADLSNNEVNQTGEKNIYTKQNSGGMKINM